MPLGKLDSKLVGRRFIPFLVIIAVFALIIGVAPSTPASTGGISRTVTLGGNDPYVTTSHNCPTAQFFSGFTTCPPSWNGHNNGGSTSQGVTTKQVNVVVYQDPQETAIRALVSGIVGSQTLNTQVYKAYEQFFNKYFQTYGRKINLIPYFSSGNLANESVVARSDAIAISEQDHAFASVGGITADYLQEAAVKHIINVSGFSLPSSFLLQYKPYVYDLLPDYTTMSQIISQFIDKQLGPNSKAQFGGTPSSPPVNGQTRRYGIIYPTTNSDGTPSIWAQTSNSLIKDLKADGISPVADIGYSINPGTASTQSTTDISKLRAAHATDVICLCDPVFPSFFTAAAQQQNWYPEWIESGYFFTDFYQFAQSYNQAEWSHAFGISAIPAQPSPQDQFFFRAYKLIDPNGPAPTPNDELLFYELLAVVEGIQGAGPNLNPVTFGNALLHVHLTSNGPAVPTIYLTNSNLSFVKDASVIWWYPTAAGPNGKEGNYELVDGGYRYLYNHWPSKPPDVFLRQCVPAGTCGNPSYPSSASP